MSTQTIKVTSVFFRPRILATPKRADGAAALFAVAGTDKSPRLFIHGERHTSFRVLRAAVEKTMEKGAINPNNWVEVKLVPWLTSTRIELVDGPVIREGFDTSTEFDEQGGGNAKQALPELEATRYGYALVEASA